MRKPGTTPQRNQFEKIYLEEKTVTQQLDTVKKRIIENSSTIESLLRQNDRLTREKDSLEKKLQMITEKKEEARTKRNDSSDEGTSL